MTTVKRDRYKLFKWIAAIFLVVFALLAGVAWFLNVKSQPLLSSRIKTLLYKSTDSLYNISFTDVSTNILTGSATLHNVKILPDTVRFNQLIALKRAPNNLYSVSLKKLVVKHFHPLVLYREQKLKLDEIIFDKPEILMVNRQFDFNENRPPKPIKSPYTIISKNLKEFSVKRILFKDVDFKYLNKNQKNSSPFDIDDLNITLTDLLVDSTSFEDPSRFYLLKDVIINLKNYHYATSNKLYNIKLGQLDFRASTGKLRVNKFQIEPLHDEMKFAEVTGYSKERYNILVDNMLINGIDLPLYISKQEFRAKEMAITNGIVSVFNNNSFAKVDSIVKSDSSALSKVDKIGKFPHQILQKLNSPLLIQKLQINDVNINYAIYNNKSQQRGEITFEHTSGLFKNVTNLPKIKAINPFMEARLSTYLLAQGKLDVNFKFDLNSPKGNFNYNGELHGFNARVLNRITKPLGLVRINSGIVDKLKFNFKANDFGSKGVVDFYYYDLSVALMKNDPDKDHLVAQGLMSMLANALVINSENPSKEGKFISSKVNYFRPSHTSFFNLIWKSLFIGIKNSVGVTEEKQKEIKQHINNFKNMQESHRLRKQKRLERRQQREQVELYNKKIQGKVR